MDHDTKETQREVKRAVRKARKRAFIMGLCLGFVIGVGLIFGLDAFDLRDGAGASVVWCPNTALYEQEGMGMPGICMDAKVVKYLPELRDPLNSGYTDKIDGAILIP